MSLDALTVTDLSSIAEKLAKFIRLLASDKDGEVVAAARSLNRVLLGIGADFHDLADRIEHPVGEISDADMEKIFQAGVLEGKRQEKQTRAVAVHGNGPLQFPSARDMAEYNYQNKAKLRSDWEIEFTDNLAAWTRTSRPVSTKQQQHLEKIYIKLGGKL